MSFTGTKIFDGTVNVPAAKLTPGNIVNSDAVPLGGSATLSSSAVGSYSSFATNGLTSTNTNYNVLGGTVAFSVTAPTAVSWNGTTTDWAASTNWTPPYLPDATIDVTIPTTTNKPVINASNQACKNLTIDASAGLTINAQGALTVSGNLTNNGATGVSILSDAANTGSLIVIGTASGTGTAQLTRTMTDGVFHLVSSPLGGQSIINFLGDPVNANTILQGTAANDITYRGMSEFNPAANNWNDYFKTNSGGAVTAGKGYSLRVRKAISTKAVVFTGTLPTGDITLTGLTGGYWNCIGNPYTSAITINSTGAATTRFLENNLNNLDPAFVSVYVWDPTTGAYTSVSNATTPTYNLQQGQAFMVRMKTGMSTVSFNRAMQVHDVSLALKSTDNIWPTINLTATADSISSSTVIAFHEGMTNGLDVSYDAGLLKADSPIDLYTRLVDDYGIPFAIQALPSDQYNQLVIPVGVDYTRGGEVSFSARGMYLPSSCRPLLEDRLTGIVTDLSDKTYTADLTANTAGTGRFYLHTSYSTTGVASRDKACELSAWAVGNQEININGQINNGAMASIFDVQGRLIVTHAMREGIRHRISLPSVNGGIYLLQVRDQQKVQVIKVIVGQ